MARRMIPVRNKDTGQEALVSQRAYGYFAGTHERLDQPTEEQPADAAEQTSTPPAAPEGSSATPTASPSAPRPPRRAAATNETE